MNYLTLNFVISRIVKKDLSMYVKGCQTVNKCIVMVVTKAEVVFRRRRNYSQVLTVRAVGILGCG